MIYNNVSSFEPPHFRIIIIIIIIFNIIYYHYYYYQHYYYYVIYYYFCPDFIRFSLSTKILNFFQTSSLSSLPH